MFRPIRLTLTALLCTAAMPAMSRAAEDPGPPIKALLIVGGCCHDYAHQKDVIPKGVSARANVQWKIAYDPLATTNHLNPIYADKDWYKGFDVIVHDECSADVKDLDVINNTILAPHKAGLPAVVLHCGMHCYRSEGWPQKLTPWFEFTGLQTTGHGAQLPIALTFLDKDSEITKGMESWTTIKEELYNNIAMNVLPTAHPLIRGEQAGNKAGKKDHFDNNTIVAWTNEYGEKKTKVFATTLGHNTETCKDDRYLDLITRGLLWSVGKLDEQHLKPAKKVFIDGPETSAVEPAKPGPAMEDLAHGKTATASSFQEDGGNTPDQAFDGVESSRWCAANGKTPQWLQVDLGKPQDLTGARLFWEFDGRNYEYKISGSADGASWRTLVDASKNKSIDQEQTAKFDAKKIRYVKLDVLGTEPGMWASVCEFNVYGTKPTDAATGPKEKKRNFNSGEIKADPSKILASVKGPKGFEVTVFAAPPDVSYVTCIAAAPDGELFIGIDKSGSVGRDPNAGKIVRARDSKGDGKADKFITFATVDHPRGLVWDDGKLYVLHPPYFGVFEAKPDGAAGQEKILIDGISTPAMVNGRGADHTTNGIRLGIDGWIYIAMGDYGAVKATGADGKTFQEHGGGIMRVRADGTDLEVYSHGHRNIYDVAIDPFMNVFTRDNTNDGDNWNDRLAYIAPSGYYGYPSYFMHFPGEFIDCLADYGGGSPCGSLFIDEPGLPGGLYTVEWGNSEVDHHPLTATGAGFKAGFEKFMTLPRGTDIDVDGTGRIYVSSWANGGFTYSGPNVGFVLCLKQPQGSVPWYGIQGASNGDLLDAITLPSAVYRQAAQRQILRRGSSSFFSKGLEKIALSGAPPAGRAAAIFTLKLLGGPNTNAALVRIAAKDDVREFALRALADRKNDPSVDLAPFIKALTDPNPRVRLVAAWGLGRLGKREAIHPLLPLLADGDLLVAHVAMQSLVALHATTECLGVVDESHPYLVLGAVRVLQHFHESAVVDGLLEKSQTLSDSPIRNQVFGGLARLYHKEADWDGQWWGTRPDTTGPYYKPVAWESTSQIGSALAAAIRSSKGDDLKYLVGEVQRNGVDAPEVTSAVASAAKSDPAIKAMLIDALAARPSLNDEQVEMLRGVAAAEEESPAARIKAIHALQRSADAGNAAAMTAAVGALTGVINVESPDPQLAAALMEFVRDFSHGERIAYFALLARKGDNAATRELSYAVLLNLSTSRLVKSPRRKAAQAELDAAWEQPPTAVALLRAIGLTKNKDYAQKVASLKTDDRPAIAQTAAEIYPLIASSESGGTTIEGLAYDTVVAAAQKDKGDAKLGAELFARQGCIACHTTSAAEAPKGPMLAGITGRYSRAELCESILKPNAKIAQGFETQWFKTRGNAETMEGFVVRESGDTIELRNAAGIAATLKKSDVTQRGKRETSVMPEGLVAKLTPHDLASILAYLESLSSK